MIEFKTRYPNRFDEREQPYFDAFKAQCDAINARGPIDVEAMINGTIDPNTPGLGPALPCTKEMLDYYALRYNPEDPLFNDDKYARRFGYKSTPAMLAFAAHDDTFMVPVPRAARDVMLVSGLNHSVTALAPIYSGDTLYLVADNRHFTDLTPESGSEYRTIAIETRGSIYNQNGEKVNEVIFRVCENLKTYKDGMKPAPDPDHPDDIGWEGPPWKRREDHKYTDEDWDLIRSVWANENMRGETPLYYEDVNIGDEPNWTIDGPIDDSLEPIPNWGMGLGGTRTLRREIMDPEIFKTMVRNPVDGIYRLPKRSMSFPAYPAYAAKLMDIKDPKDFAACIAENSEPFNVFEMNTSFAENDDPACEPPERFMLINFYGRDFAQRHFTNWCGAHGWVKNIRWGIMPDLCMKHYGYDLPTNPEALSFMDPYPEMKGKCIHHGMERDIMLIKSKVYDKHIENGEHLVELVWWIESIIGDVFEEGQATVRLPSRE